MANRLDGGLWDNECPHGVAMRGWCSICRHPYTPKRRKPDAPESSTKPKPKCSVCQRKRDKGQPGHRYHRSYQPIYAENSRLSAVKFNSPRDPDRPLGWKQVRRVFDATHRDDAGRQVCDECCHGRCSRCKSLDPTQPSFPRLNADAMKGEREPRLELVSERSPLLQHLVGQSVGTPS